MPKTHRHDPLKKEVIIMTEKLVRINTRIGKKHNDFLDNESDETGMSKSSIVQLAVDQYMTQRQSIATLSTLVEKIEELEKRLEE